MLPSFPSLRLETAQLNPVYGNETPLPVSTGVSTLDGILKGGLPRGSLTEVYGLPESGKTSLVLTIAASIAQSGGSAILLDCDGDIAPARALQVLACRNADPSAVTRISLSRVTSWEALTAGLVHLLPDLVGNYKDLQLIAVDSLAFLFRTANGSAPHKRLETFAMRMQAIAADYRLCIVFVNHVRATTDGGPVVPAMGEAWQHVCATRLYLRKDFRGDRIIEVEKSPFVQVGGVRFEIGASGVFAREESQDN